MKLTFNQIPVDTDKARGVLDIGVVAEYGPVFFGMLIAVIIVYFLQGIGRLPVPTKAVKSLQDELNQERKSRQALEVELATMKERLRAIEEYRPRVVHGHNGG